MISLFIVALIMAFSLSMFSISYKYKGMDKIVTNAPISIFELSIPVNYENITTLHFESSELEKRYEEYIASSINNYANSYSIVYRYYSPIDGGIEETYPQGVEVKLIANIVLNYKFEKTMFYEIIGKNNG